METFKVKLLAYTIADKIIVIEYKDEVISFGISLVNLQIKFVEYWSKYGYEKMKLKDIIDPNFISKYLIKHKPYANIKVSLFGLSCRIIDIINE